MTKSDNTYHWIVKNIHTLDATGGMKPFPEYSFVQRLVDALENNRILIVAKSRQMMATWTVCAWFLFRAIEGETGHYLLLSKGKRDSKELMNRLQIMKRNLTGDMQKGIRIGKEEAEFPSGSRITSLPATEYAPRMHSPSGVFWDEMAFTENTEGIWTALKPAVDSGGSFAGVSTPNGTDNVFHRLYTDDENGFSKLKLHWKEHPERDKSWMRQAQRGLSEARWRQEYEVDFEVMADRVYDEFDPELHKLKVPYQWQRGSGRTYRGIDFGYRHPYVIWVHESVDGDLTVFAEWEGFDSTVEELAEAVKRVDKEYGIEEDDVTWTACDPAGAATNDTGTSSVERLQNLGFRLRYQQSRIMDGIELVKSLLRDATGRVRLRFAPETLKTIDHLCHYRWDPSHDRPNKDNEHDHAVDALRYLVINLFGTQTERWSGAMVAGAKW